MAQAADRPAHPPLLPAVLRQQAQGSVTVTTTVAEERLVLRLRPRERKQVTWQEDTIDNEDMGKKSSKKCCIFHKPRAFDESSSDEEGDDEERRKRFKLKHPNGDHKCNHDHQTDGQASQDHASMSESCPKNDDNSYANKK